MTFLTNEDTLHCPEREIRILIAALQVRGGGSNYLHNDVLSSVKIKLGGLCR